MSTISLVQWMQSLPIDRAESLKIDIAVMLDRALQEKAFSRKQLAEILGTSPAWVTKVLRGDVNLTIETMTKLTEALELDLEIKISRRGHKQESGTVFDFDRYTKPQFKGAKEFKLKENTIFSTCNDSGFYNAA